VTAKDQATGKENKIRIEGGSQLSKEEIERMKAEAEANAESDRLEKEKVDKLNQADNMIFQTEKQIKEFDEKLTESDKIELNSILSELRTAHKDQDITKIDSEMEKLNESWNRISTNLYSQASQDPQPDSGQPQAEDINFEEVK
jgi:molecular chaperone DnaK